MVQQNYFSDLYLAKFLDSSAKEMGLIVSDYIIQLAEKNVNTMTNMSCICTIMSNFRYCFQYQVVFNDNKV